MCKTPSLVLPLISTLIDHGVDHRARDREIELTLLRLKFIYVIYIYISIQFVPDRERTVLAIVRPNGQCCVGKY